MNSKTAPAQSHPHQTKWSRFRRNLLYNVLRWSLVPWFLRMVVQRRKVSIFLYHDLNPRLADVHFRELRRRYHFISLREFVDAHETGTLAALPPRAAIVTLDDGHARNAALKSILDRHQIPATIFLCSGIVGTMREFWFQHPMCDDYRQYLKTLPNEERLYALQELGFEETREIGAAQSLSSAEIDAMRGTVDFQAHSAFHPCLPNCSPPRARREIVDAKRELEDRYGLAIYALAYPNGDYGEREIALAKEAGYRCALTTEVGYADQDSDLYRLPRVWIDDEAGVSELIVDASGMYGLMRGWLEKARLFALARRVILGSSLPLRPESRRGEEPKCGDVNDGRGMVPDQLRRGERIA